MSSNFSLGEALLATGVDLQGLTSGLQRAEGAAGSAVGRMGGVFSNLLGGVLQGVGQSLFSAISGAVGNVTGAMIGGNAEFERYNVQFGVLLGSAEAAEARLAELAQFGATTPFELPQVVQADKILTGFGLRADDVKDRFGFMGEDILRIAGDVAAGTGAGFDEMAVLLGKFSSGATGEAISRMQELGIVTREQLAGMGLEFSKSGQLLTPVDEAMDVVLQSMQDKFGGMMDAQSATFEGMQSNLTDWLAATGRALGEPIFDALKDQLGNLLAILNSESMQAGLNAIVEFLTEMASGNFEDPLGSIANIVFFLAQAFGASKDEATNAFMAVVGLRDGFDQLVAGGQLVWAALQQAFGTLQTIDFGPLLAALGQLFGAMSVDMPSAGSIFQTVAGLITAAVQGIADFMNNILLPGLTAVVSWVATNWPTIRATVQQVMQGVQTAIQTVLDWARTFWQTWGNDILAVLNFVKTQWTTIFQAFSAAFRGDWAEFGRLLRVAWDNAWREITGIVERAISWFSTRDWGAIGQDILRGIANGITAATGFVVDAARRAAQAALDALKGFLGISSPSSVMAERIGQPAGEGIAAGVLDSIPSIRAAAATAGAALVADGRTFNIDARGATLSGSEFEQIVRRVLDDVGLSAHTRVLMGVS